MRPQVLFLAAGLIAGAAAFAACSSDGDLGMCFTDEQRQRDLEVQVGNPVRFSWCGAPAQRLSVAFSGGGSTVWQIECVNPVRCIFFPIVYGEIPRTRDGEPDPQVRQPIIPQPLQPGEGYEVCVAQTVPVDHRLCAAFTP
jgi:hypothetical protein